MKVNWKKEQFTYNHLSLDFTAARNLIRAAFPVLVRQHMVKSDTKNGVIEPVVDWRPLFLNPAIQVYLMDYLGDDAIGFCTGYDTINKRNVKFFATDFACVLSYPPQKMDLSAMAKVVATETNLPEKLNNFYERYYR